MSLCYCPSRATCIERLYIFLDHWMRQKRQDESRSGQLWVDSDNRDVLVHTRGEYVFIYKARSSKCNSVSSNVEKNVIHSKIDSLQPTCLFI